MKKRKYSLSILLLIYTALLCGCSASDINNLSQTKKEATGNIFAMDTYMQIDVYGVDSDTAISEALSLIQDYDQKWSVGNSESEISIVNETGSVTVSEETENLLSYAVQMHQETGGDFNPAIYPLVELWGFPTGEYQVPSSKDLETLLPHTDFSEIHFDPETHILNLPPQMKLDFGAIAKGYTAQQIADMLLAKGIDSAMISLGGNIQCVGYKKDGSEWRVGIQNPEGDAPLGIVTTHDRALVTSGDYQRYFEKDGIKYHHIIDPQTGCPADSGLRSITVECSDGTKADALSTALFVMGKEDAINYWRSHCEEFDLILYTTEKELLITKGLKNRFSSSLPYTVVE